MPSNYAPHARRIPVTPTRKEKNIMTVDVDENAYRGLVCYYISSIIKSRPSNQVEMRFNSKQITVETTLCSNRGDPICWDYHISCKKIHDAFVTGTSPEQVANYIFKFMQTDFSLLLGCNKLGDDNN